MERREADLFRSLVSCYFAIWFLSGTGPVHWDCFCHVSFSQPDEGAVVLSDLWKQKLRPREAKWPAQSHTAAKEQGWESLDSLIPGLQETFLTFLLSFFNFLVIVIKVASSKSSLVPFIVDEFWHECCLVLEIQTVYHPVKFSVCR